VGFDKYFEVMGKLKRFLKFLDHDSLLA